MASKIPLYQPTIGKKELSRISKCVRSGMISSLGQEVSEFESRFAHFTGAPYATAVSNGTVALHLILETLGIGVGDEVIVPAFTFVSTANAVTYTGARPVFVDVSFEDWAIDYEQVKQALTRKTKAILVVHLYGAVSKSIAQLQKLASQKGIHLIEDAAEALGSKNGKKHVGNAGIFSAFSFYGNKLITTGEGGMVLSNHKTLTQRFRFLRDQAMDMKRRYYHPVLGFNYRITAMQAAIGLAQMEQIHSFMQKKKKNFEAYDDQLQNLPFVCNPNLISQNNLPWLYNLLFFNEKDRKKCENHLSRKGIDTRPLFVPLPKLPMYKEKKKYPVSQVLSKCGLSLPSFPNLSVQEIKRIAKAIRSIF